MYRQGLNSRSVGRIPTSSTPKTPQSQLFTPFEEHFKIYLRVKPMLDTPQAKGTIRILSQHKIEVTPPYYSTEPDRHYHYEGVFPPQSTNQELFAQTVTQPISNVLSGYNSTIFIYGMTGAGKTHTMFNQLLQESPNDEGLVGQTIDQLFEKMEMDNQHRYQLRLSFYEIYNQNIRDLLGESQVLQIMEDPVKGVTISDLKQVLAEDANQARRCIQEGLTKRAINATKNNQNSSRSHAILQFTLRKYTPHQSDKMAMSESKMFMIDLAGNEKASQHQNKRFVEGVNINKSLLTLGKCINILSEQKKTAFLPFRDSKLTRILKDSLGGNSKTVMIACVSAEQCFYEETLNTLKYSTKARKIKNKGKGGTVKIVQKKDVRNQFVPQSQDRDHQTQERLLQQFRSLQEIIQKKVRLSIIKQDLEQSMAENEQEYRVSKNQDNWSQMKEISEMIPQINLKLREVSSKIEKQLKRMACASLTNRKDPTIAELVTCKQRIKRQNEELMHCKQINKEQYEKIRFMESQVNTSYKYEEQESKESQPLKKGQSFILIREESGKSQSKYSSNLSIKAPTINLTQHQQVAPYQEKVRSKTPQDSLKSSSVFKVTRVETETDRPMKKKIPNKPIIDISMDGLKLKSPSYDRTFISSVATEGSKENVRPSKNTFIQRLTTLEKNSSSNSRSDVISLLEELELHGYDLSKTEQCMVNKLKFMLKTTDKHPSRKARDLKQPKVTRLH